MNCEWLQARHVEVVRLRHFDVQQDEIGQEMRVSIGELVFARQVLAEQDAGGVA